MRSRISPAALFVNVTARIWSGRTTPSPISRAMRAVSTRVLPGSRAGQHEQRAFAVLHRFTLRGIQGRSRRREFPAGW